MMKNVGIMRHSYRSENNYWTAIPQNLGLISYTSSYGKRQDQLTGGWQEDTVFRINYRGHTEVAGDTSQG